MDIKYAVHEPSCLKYSELNQKLILSDSWETLLSIDLRKKRVEFITKRKEVDDRLKLIVDFELAGEKENKMISLLTDRGIIIYTVDYRLKKICKIQEFKLSCFCGDFHFMAICDQRKYLIMRSSTNIYLYKLEGSKLTQQARLYHLHYLANLMCFGYLGNHVLWVGIPSYSSGYVRLYHYDLEKKQLKELSDKRVLLDGKNYRKIRKVGDHLYLAGNQGRIKKVNLKFK